MQSRGKIRCVFVVSSSASQTSLSLPLCPMISRFWNLVQPVGTSWVLYASSFVITRAFVQSFADTHPPSCFLVLQRLHFWESSAVIERAQWAVGSLRAVSPLRSAIGRWQVGRKTNIEVHRTSIIYVRRCGKKRNFQGQLLFCRSSTFSLHSGFLPYDNIHNFWKFTPIFFVKSNQQRAQDTCKKLFAVLCSRRISG